LATTNFVDGQTVIEASWLNDVNTAVYNPSAALIPASSIVNTPAGNIAATDVQTALNELDTEKAAVVHVHAGTDITSGVVAIANGGTGQATAALAFTALKQAASDTATGVVELSTAAEAPDRTKTAVVLTPATLRDALVAQNDAPTFACRAWVNFDASSGTPTIVGSGNVSSITDNGVGDFTVNFTTAMPDANYAVIFTNTTNIGTHVAIGLITSKTAAAIRFTVVNSAGAAADYTQCNVAVFR